MQQIRSFVAIELDPAMRTGIQRAQAQLKAGKHASIARWVAPESIHLTLQFLGDVPVDRVDKIGQAVQRACRPFGPFDVHLSDLGCFPNPRKARVLWVGVGGDVETLARLQRAVESELQGLGFAPENRPFQPHLTLARIKDWAGPEERSAVADQLARVQPDASAAMTVREVHLMKSDLRPSGAVYTSLATAQLEHPRGLTNP